jgi:hypothetical protein
VGIRLQLLRRARHGDDHGENVARCVQRGP